MTEHPDMDWVREATAIAQEYGWTVRDTDERRRAQEVGYPDLELAMPGKPLLFLKLDAAWRCTAVPGGIDWREEFGGNYYRLQPTDVGRELLHALLDNRER